MTATLAPPTTMHRQVLTLNPRTHTGIDVGELHKLVMSAFLPNLDGAGTVTLPDGTQAGPRAQANILFAALRQRPSSRATRPRAAGAAHKLLIQSDLPPDWSMSPFLKDRTLSVSFTDPFEVDTTIHSGDFVEITGFVNATASRAPEPQLVDRSQGRHARGRRYPLTRPSDVGAWLDRTMDRAGATLALDTVEVSEALRVSGTRGNSAIFYDGCQITARVNVNDPDAFTRVLHEGIGRSRAYGAGLLRHRIIK